VRGRAPALHQQEGDIVAQPKMRCQECRVWLDVNEPQVVMPSHYLAAKSGKPKCKGSGHAPLETRGFKRPPPSIK
jgi:hypothetical protein